MKKAKDICVIYEKKFKSGDIYVPIKDKLICQECFKELNPLGIR